MKNKRIAELMGWPPNFNRAPGDLADKLRTLTAAAEAEEREACADLCELNTIQSNRPSEEIEMWNKALRNLKGLILGRSNDQDQARRKASPGARS